MAFVIPSIFEAIDKLTAPLRKMESAVGSFANKAQTGVAKANATFNKLIPTFSEIQKQALSMVGTFAIVGGLFSLGNLGVQSIKDYETALHSLEAVTGQSSASFKTQIESIAKSSHKSAIDVASSFEVIGSAMSQYLDNPKALGQITEAGITLSKASRMELTPTLEALTSVMNQFKLSAGQANDTINRLTAGEIVGSVSTAKIAVALQEFGANAYGANVKLSESVALLETLGKQMDHSKIAVGARNLLNTMSSAKGLDKNALKSLQQHGVSLDVLMNKAKPLGDRLKELSKIQGDAVAMVNVFGKENITAGNVIFANLATYQQWQKQIETTNKANEQAAVNSNTLANALTEIKNAFINSIVTGDKLTPTLEKIKKGFFWIAENMGTILDVGIKLAGVLLGIKAILWLSTIAIGAYNIGLGVMGALSGTASIAIGQNALALGAYKAALWVATAAQWLWNAAMTANPIGLIIVGIGALIAIIAVVVNKWNQWGAAVSLLLGPLGFVISLIQSFRRNWEMVTKAFNEGGVLAGFIAIGKVILDAVLQPIQQVLEIISKITGADWAKNAAKGLNDFRANMGVNVTTDESGKALNGPVSTKATQNEVTQRMYNENKSSLGININDGTGRATVDNPSNFPGVVLNSTHLFGQR